MIGIAMAFATGFILGTVFAIAHQPVPAPPTLAGAAGVVGVTVAFIVVSKVRK